MLGLFGPLPTPQALLSPYAFKETSAVIFQLQATARSCFFWGCDPLPKGGSGGVGICKKKHIFNSHLKQDKYKHPLLFYVSDHIQLKPPLIFEMNGQMKRLQYVEYDVHQTIKKHKSVFNSKCACQNLSDHRRVFSGKYKTRFGGSVQ